MTPVTTAISSGFSLKSTGKKNTNMLSGVRDVHDPGPQERAHVVQVIRRAGDEVPGLVRHEEGVVQLEEPVVDPLPQAVLHQAGGADDEPPHEVHGGHGDGRVDARGDDQVPGPAPAGWRR